METKELLHEVADYGLDSDGLMSWEEFYGSSSEDLVGSILEMYDLLIGRSSEIKDDLMSPRKSENGFLEKFQSPFEEVKSKDSHRSFGLKSNPDNWCDLIKRNWNCRCTEKTVIEAITRCAACNTKEPQVRSTVIRDALAPCPPAPLDAPRPGAPAPKCELLTCPAGFSTPTTPVQERLKRLTNHSPLTLKRNDNGFRYVTRPSSVSSLASSSSSSSSGASSCFGARRLGVSHKSSAYLASIESLEDDSDIESPVQKNESFRSGKESEGSEDSGVHSPCASIPQDRPKYCDPHLSYMDKVVMEIIQTEEVYVGDLRKIIEGYLWKWRSVPDFPLADRLDSLFGNIEAISHFNSSFLTELEQCGLDPVKVARCFVKNNSGFSVYTEYCTNYPRTVSLLTELMRQEGTVRLFRERQTALQHTLPLGSYLLKPVQRILKYHLLLQNIVKQYSMGFDGYKDIVDALRTMTEIAQHINDMKRRHEHEVRVQEIQSLLLGWEGEDLTTYGELCAEGAFRMYGAKAIRHVFLFDKMVLITKKKEGGILSYKTHINCSNLMLIESVPGEPLSFHVIPFDNPKLQYTLQCRNLEQKREWTLQLKRVILENYNAVIPSHARQLVMELGQNRTEDENFTTKILPKRQHLAPEYLEKRKQDKRKTESSLKSRLQKNKKLEAGEKLENQFDKPRPATEQTKSGSGVKRRQSEPEMHVYDKDKETEDYEENPKESRTGAEPPEKLEINTLEQIVAQILKQNREFDKILKRKKQNIIVRSHEFASRRRKKREESKTLSKQNSENLADASDSDYATLLEESRDRESSANDGAPRSKEFRRSHSYTSEFESKAAEQLSKISLEDGIPTSPSVWLRQQGHHLPTPTKKAGSLPRSFQISSESSPDDPRSFRDFRVSIERPFTIASDKLPPTMLFEGMERYCKGQFHRSNSDGTEDGSLTEGLTTPGASLDHINIHPEYKIYKSSMSASILKNVLTSVQTKLSHIKAEMSPKLESEKKTNADRKASRVVGMLTKQYHRSLRYKQKGKNSDGESKPEASPRTPEPVLPVYRQGSSGIGARLANFSESEHRINRVRPSKKAASLLGVGAGSVLSLSSAPASPEKSSRAIDRDVDASTRNTDESIDIYERTFEAMDEQLLQEAELQDLDADGGKKNEDEPTPPPVPAKPSKQLIIEKMAEMSEKHQVGVFETEMKKEEEGDTSSQHSTASTVIEIKCPETSEILFKGWVKHVVGKIQGEL